jgi:hypothetical protein
MLSPSGRYSNGKWIPTNPPQIDPPTPPSPPQKVGRGPYVSKTSKPGTKEAIKTAFVAGFTTLEEVKKEIESEGFYLGIESIRTIMRKLKIGKRYKKRVKKKPLKAELAIKKLHGRMSHE